jgi:hypothetical protein
LWFFLRSPDGSIRSLPTRQFERFFARRERLENCAGKLAVIVELAVEVEDRRPKRVLRAVWSKYKIDQNGLWDEQHKPQSVRDILNYSTVRLLRQTIAVTTDTRLG